MDDSENELNANAGLIAVLSRGAAGWLVFEGHTVHAFTRRGAHVASVGRSGAGPGEYRAIGNGCMIRGDSVALYDSGNRRFSVLSPDLRHQRVIEASPSPMLGFSCLRDGRIVALLLSFSAARRIELTVELISPEGRGRRQVAVLDGGAVTAVGSPRASVYAIGNRIFVAPAAKSEILELNDEGAVLRTLRTADPLVTARPAELEAMIERMLPLPTSGVDREATRARLKARGFPTHWPSYAQVLSGENGEVWIEDYPAPNATASVWTRLDANWRITGRVSIPQQDANGRVRVLGFFGDLVLLWERDGDGFTRVVGRRLLATR